MYNPENMVQQTRVACPKAMLQSSSVSLATSEIDLAANISVITNNIISGLKPEAHSYSKQKLGKGPQKRYKATAKGNTRHREALHIPHEMK